eukprot:GHVS01038926.1.p1 GENE.GHVS01038926.1~~GHVS01038926.1.p1  ORF type:complete len:186 (+),score=41.95 GHVS01038926.1:251-808(+)
MYCFCAPSISIVPFICPITFICCVVYPLYRSLALLYHPTNPITTISSSSSAKVDGSSSSASSSGLLSEYTQWLMFWMIFSLFAVVEHFLTPLLPFIPLFMEMKCILFTWLAYDEFHGAGWIWVAVASRHYKKVDECLVSLYHQHCPIPLKNFLQSPTTKKGGAAGGFEKAREAVGSVGVEGLKAT